MALEQRRFPVVEIFGPTIQGEGMDQGLPVHFVRLGGCDYRCEWCDTPQAVLPERVREAARLTGAEIADRVGELGGAPEWVVISGGNPALHDLGELVELLHRDGLRVSAETQGSRWREWLADVDRLCVSPKPPSSGMTTCWDDLSEVLDRRAAVEEDAEGGTFLKTVVFDAADYAFAREVRRRYPQLPLYLSAGNDPGSTVGAPALQDGRSLDGIRADLCTRSAWLASQLLVDPAMGSVRVQSQYHVLLWGNRAGV